MADPLYIDWLTGRDVRVDDDGDAYCPDCGCYVHLNCHRGSCGHVCEGCGCPQLLWFTAVLVRAAPSKRDNI